MNKLQEAEINYFTNLRLDMLQYCALMTDDEVVDFLDEVKQLKSEIMDLENKRYIVLRNFHIETEHDESIDSYEPQSKIVMQIKSSEGEMYKFEAEMINRKWSRVKDE